MVTVSLRYHIHGEYRFSIVSAFSVTSYDIQHVKNAQRNAVWTEW